MDSINVNSQIPLTPLLRVTKEDLEKIRVGVSLMDLSRLGLIGEYKLVEATADCPALYYRFNYIKQEWEIYALVKDLIDYNLLKNGDNSDRITLLDGRVIQLEDEVFPTGIPTDDPTISPTSAPTIEPIDPPTIDPPSWHSSIGRDPNLIGGDDLTVLIDGGIIIFSGRIKWYQASSDLQVSGNYVGVTITPNPEIFEKYKYTMRLEYKGMVYDSRIFYRGQVTLYVNIRCPGQEVPVTIFWSNELIERFTVAVTQESILETE